MVFGVCAGGREIFGGLIGGGLNVSGTETTGGFGLVLGEGGGRGEVLGRLGTGVGIGTGNSGGWTFGVDGGVGM